MTGEDVIYAVLGAFLGLVVIVAIWVCAMLIDGAWEWARRGVRPSIRLEDAPRTRELTAGDFVRAGQRAREREGK
jgi:hypothetical protein